MSRQESILVVDDAPTVQHFLRMVLAQAGYKDVDIAGTVCEAKAALARHEYAIAFIDKHLEDGDGFTVAREARARSPHTVRVMMTADQSLETAIHALEEDIFAYLTKPLRRPEVLLKTRRGLDRVALSRERLQARADLEAANAELERRASKLEEALGQLVTAQSRLMESDKLAALGALAAGVAHEINNPACFILPNLDYLRKNTRRLSALASADAAGDAKGIVGHTERMLDRCQEGVERIQHVVRTLQLFSRRDREHAIAVDLDHICRALLELVTHELDGTATLVVELEAGVWVRAREEELGQAILNLLLSARRAVLSAPDRGPHRITLQTRLAEDDEVVLSVRDTGEPLATGDDVDRVLDPFYAGFDMNEGPGLGLSLARELLHRNGGRLLLQCEDGGNLLEARLPITEPTGSYPAVSIGSEASPAPHR